MINRICYAGIVALFVVTSVAQAQEAVPSPWELTLGGAASASPDFSGGAIGTGFGLGYFFTKDFELGGRETLNYSSFPNGTNWLSTTRATADYHFDLGNLRPFVGAQTGIVHGLHATTSFEVGPEVGLKYNLNSTTFAYGIFEYEWFAKDRKLKGGIREQQYIVSFGLGFRF